jgi:hypothetical protein
MENLITKVHKEKKDDKEEEVKTIIKNLKMKRIPLDLRPKLLILIINSFEDYLNLNELFKLIFPMFILLV